MVAAEFTLAPPDPQTLCEEVWDLISWSTQNAGESNRNEKQNPSRCPDHTPHTEEQMTHTHWEVLHIVLCVCVRALVWLHVSVVFGGDSREADYS